MKQNISKQLGLYLTLLLITGCNGIANAIPQGVVEPTRIIQSDSVKSGASALHKKSSVKTTLNQPTRVFVKSSHRQLLQQAEKTADAVAAKNAAMIKREKQRLNKMIAVRRPNAHVARVVVKSNRRMTLNRKVVANSSTPALLKILQLAEKTAEAKAVKASANNTALIKRREMVLKKAMQQRHPQQKSIRK